MKKNLDRIITESIRHCLLKSTRLGLKRIDEASITRMLSHGKEGYIIVSSQRSGMSIEGKPDADLYNDYEEWLQENGLTDKEGLSDKWLAQRNRECEKELNAAVKNSPYTYSKVYGGYQSQGEDDPSTFEPSYFIYCKDNNGNDMNFNDLYDFGMELGRYFKQDSIYVQFPNGEANYVDPRNGNKDAHADPKNTKIDRRDLPYYTSNKRDKHNASRFTADMQWENTYKRVPGSLMEKRRRYAKYGEIFL